MKVANYSSLRIAMLVFIAMLVTACGGGSEGVVTVTAPSATSLTMTLGLKQFKFSWNKADGATYYKLLENPDGSSGYTLVGSNISATSFDHVVPLYARLNASYIIAACNSAGCTNSNAFFITGTLEEAIGYVKASNAEAWDRFGSAVALSDDGMTMAISATTEDSAATGVDGVQGDNSAADTGAVYVFSLVSGVWAQQAYIKPSISAAGVMFGQGMALSGDGNTLAVNVSGSVYIFGRDGLVWSQKKLLSVGSDGYGVSLSDNGDTLSVVASGNTFIFVKNAGVWTQQDVLSVGVEPIALSGDGDTIAISHFDDGVVYIYSRSNGVWSQQGLKTIFSGWSGWGSSVALSDDGSTLVVGASSENSAASGIDGDETNSGASYSGAVFVFSRVSGVWSREAYIKASNAGAFDRFGFAVDLSNDGDSLVVGAYGEDGSAKGLNGTQDDAAGPTSSDGGSSGAAYVFSREGSVWFEQAYLKASNTEETEEYGRSVAISGDGSIVAIGDDYEASGSVGIGGDQINNSAYAAGAVFLY